MVLEEIHTNVSHVWDSYLWYLNQADVRTRDWPLIGSYWPTVMITLIYFILSWLGPKFMSSRPPLQLKGHLLVYNLVLVVINAHIVYELVVCSVYRRYNYLCTMTHFGSDPHEFRIAKAIWWFYISKCVELLDTAFFVLRKKTRQLSFLHVYHHASMPTLMWISVMWYPGGSGGVFFPMLNGTIHVFMYLYYGLSVLGPSVQKYLWWKKYLTTMQMVQFVVLILHTLQSLGTKCPFPKWLHYVFLFYCSTFLVLFMHYYRQTYAKQKQT